VATCKACGEEVDELFSVKIGGRTRRLCEECSDKANEQQEIQEESEAAVQQMMGFKGRRP
jgi:NMD protein affecting ribosome stability and mRNA decay